MNSKYFYHEYFAALFAFVNQLIIINFDIFHSQLPNVKYFNTNCLENSCLQSINEFLTLSSFV